jgi:hypothetical protein
MTDGGELLRKPKVLLVDDDERVRTTLGMVLSHHDFEVVLAGNLNDALKQIGSQVFDVLLSDLHMPQAGDGFPEWIVPYKRVSTKSRTPRSDACCGRFLPPFRELSSCRVDSPASLPRPVSMR